MSDIHTFIDQCCTEFELKQALMLKEFPLQECDHFDYDLEATELLFSKEGEILYRAKFTPIGIYSKNDNVWLWAWADEGMPESLRNKSLKLKEILAKTPLERAQYNAFESTDDDSQELAAIATVMQMAIGQYCAVEDDNLFYMCIDGIIAQ